MQLHLSLLITAENLKMSNANYHSVKFEARGKVQGVFFRKYTKAKAEELSLNGWCRNTPAGTVEGEFEYTPNNRKGAREFRYWLENVGSPHSRVDGCTFSEEEEYSTKRFDGFKVVR